MPDPRNVQHDKTVQQEKKNHGEAVTPADAVAKVQPGKKPEMKHHASDEKKQTDDASSK